MFLLFSLTKAYNWTDPGNYSQTLSAGYYNITIIGAQGGYGCSNGEVAKKNKNDQPIEGGHGAIISGILHLKGTNDYQIVVGDMPITFCQSDINNQNPGSTYGEGGYSGSDFTGSSGDQSGGGGGYSFFGLDYDNYIVISGGGGGATYWNNGGSAGGRNYNFMVNSKYFEEICQEDCFTNGRYGGNGIDSGVVPGGGGGGGFKGGKGGVNSITNAYLSAGKGGSSDWRKDYFYGDVTESVGINNNATGNGSLHIETIKFCNESCYDCDYDDVNFCTQCYPDKYLYEGVCYDKCPQSPFITYPDNETRKCSKCPIGEIADKEGKCVPKPTPMPSSTPSSTPSNTPSSTPSSTPSNTPSSTPSSTPSNTPSSTPDATSDALPTMTPTANPQDGQMLNSAPTDVPSNQNEKDNRLGLIIGVTVGSLALIGLIAVAAYFLLKQKDENETCDEEMMEETAISADYGMITTLENPVFTTTVSMNSEDIFADDFEEKDKSDYFHFHDEEL